jgi:hypothetical protein
MRKLVTILFLAVATISVAQESVKLRINYTKGDVYTGTMIMTQDMGTIMSMSMNLDTEIKVTDVKDDTYSSEMKFTKMSMNMLQGGNLMSYDSSMSDAELDEAGKAIKTQMAPMLEAVIFTKGNNLGEMLEVKAEPNLPGMEDLTSQPSSVVYPKEAIKVGSTWSLQKKSKGMINDFVYVVKSISSDSVELTVSGKVSGMGTGDITGNIKIDRASGIPLSSLIDINAVLAQGQELKSTITLKMSKN